MTNPIDNWRKRVQTAKMINMEKIAAKFPAGPLGMITVVKPKDGTVGLLLDTTVASIHPPFISRRTYARKIEQSNLPKKEKPSENPECK